MKDKKVEKVHETARIWYREDFAAKLLKEKTPQFVKCTSEMSDRNYEKLCRLIQATIRKEEPCQ
jgi:hypothetical protein